MPSQTAADVIALGVIGFAVLFGLTLEPKANADVTAAPVPQADSPPHADHQVAVRRAAARDAHGDLLPFGVTARLGTVRFRYGGEVVFSPDGKTLVAKAHQALILLDVATGKERQYFQGPPGGFAGTPAFTADGQLLAASDGRGTLFVWDTASGKESQRIAVPAKCYFMGRAFAPDGKTLALVSSEGWIALVDRTTGQVARKCVGHKPRVRFVTFSADGLTLVSVGADQTVRLWDVMTGKQHRQFHLGHKGPLGTVSFSADGRTLVSAGWGDGIIGVWDVGTGKQTRRLGMDKNNPHLHGVALSGEGRTLAVAGGDKVVRLWELSTGRALCSFQAAGPVAFSPDGKILAANNPFRTTLYLWDAATGKLLNSSVGHTSPVDMLAVSANGTRIASGSRDGAILLWQVVPAKHLRQFAGHTDQITGLAFSQDGQVLASLSKDNTIRIWQVSAGQELGRLVCPPEEVIASLALAPHGKTVAAGSTSGTVSCWQVATGKKLHQFQAHPDRLDSDGEPYTFAVSVLVFSPDGKLLATGMDENETVRIFDAATGTRQRQLAVPLSAAKDNCSHKQATLAFSPDGKTLAVGSGHKMVRFWEVASGKVRHQLHGTNVAGSARYSFAGSEKWPYTLAYSPSGKMVGSWGSQHDTVRVWDAATGKELAHLRGHRGDVTAVAFLPNGRGLVSASVDTTILVWASKSWKQAEQPAVKPLAASELQALWVDLRSDDAAKAYRAILALSGAPKEALPFLQEHLRPVPAPDPKHLARLVADLDADRFDAREKASNELVKLGLLAAGALRQMMAGKPSLEVRLRVEKLLQRLDLLILTPDELQVWRAIEVLENIGTTEARQVLEKLGQGAAEARQTEEAKAANARLANRPPVSGKL
jgi:WD40 repeat protein